MLPNTIASEIDPRVARTHLYLENALAELMSEKDFGKITVQDITDRAGINRATFYKHFEDKYALLTHIVKQQFRAKLDQKIEAESMLIEQNLQELVSVVCEMFADISSPTMCATLFTERHILYVLPEIQGEMYQTVVNWIKNTHVDCEEDGCEAAATMISTAIFGSIMQLNRQKNINVEAMVITTILPLIMSGIAEFLGQPVQ